VRQAEYFDVMAEIKNRMNYKELKTDVLIIGQGAAGLRTAIELTHAGVSCLVLSKRAHGDAHTKWAAGGINAALANLDAEDSWQIHAADTLREGQFVCDPGAVELITKKSPERVKELQEWGCSFNKTDNGKINQRYFGAQSYRRTCFVGDRTGEAILKTLITRAEEIKVPSRVNTYVTRILIAEGRACGAIGFDMKTGEKLVFKAKAVVLACGGFASIYNRSSSRPDENTADNAGLGYEAGAVLQDMEFIQFHPTGMVKPEEMSGRLVSEAVRGEGGRLFNKNKERFMKNYSPEKMELDARDVVARAIFQEIREGRGTPGGGVWLDISHKDAAFIKERLPKLVKRFKEFDIDFTKEAVEVAPTSHYAMGGLKVDFKTGETTVKGLFAAGESTAGVHGANRLGGNSLAETVVIGQITGAHLSKVVDSFPEPEVGEQLINENFEKTAGMINRYNFQDPGSIMSKIKEILWEHAGIIRDAKSLEEGLEKLLDLKNEGEESVKQEFRGGPEDWEKACNLSFIFIAAEAVLRGALLRKESRGAHYRKDFPEKNDDWVKNIHYRKDGEKMDLFTAPVAAIPGAIQKALDEGHHLDYHHLE
jgi:succinate dehydrogenase / fumarate reductase, flavoprotein subunit